MSDSISVKVQRGSYNFANPAQQQTQVRVYIPEVARAFYLLPASAFDELRDAEWGDVLDAVFADEDHAEKHGARAVAESLDTARKAIRVWAQADENRDALNAAWFQDRARRDPVSRTLLRDKDQLLARVAELEKANAGLDDLRVRALDKNSGLQARVDEVERAYTFDTAELKQKLDAALARVAGLEGERHSTNEALADTTVAQRRAEASADRLTRLLAPTQALREDAGPEVPPLTVFRASHDSIVMGHYKTREAAREHCETLMRRDVGEEAFLGWVPDHGGDDAPEELCFGEDVECSGYYVTPLEIASEYDPDGDE